ncbi:DNA-binding transcriptional regulator, LysR family [Paenibacillus sp. UNCCL117]|uniref:LysR family transcriptional regulator n=1 Tax=unclassified Paenibacillus TaxID=185978 RepID=UPI000890D087|nr:MULTISPECIES: LysR family transcriptional regulator [unclassified Paenibacillus]SDD83686.1 DNA-binding transcriptional regulator, LysR family [Paenibacillus sp. cl123]SFW54803.1 DNA-binding transcriptional regulator, LysR family [Paenibacillus sp. UNCCL117]
MDFKTLKTFQMIVKHGSFNRAAQEMNYVQSTVTMQIQKLESELGVQLIERGKEVGLTEAGRLLYDQSLQIVKNMEQLQASLLDMKSGEAGHIRVGVTEPTASYRLPGILKKFMSMYPNIHISLEISSTTHLSELVLKGEIDFSLCTAPGAGSDLYFEPLFAEEFVAVLPEDHPLLQKTVIEPEDFQGYRLLVTSATCPYRKKLEMTMQEKGIVSLDTMEIGSMTALKFYVEEGLGIALVPKITVESGNHGTRVRRITGSLIEMTFGILCKEWAYPFQLARQKLYQYLKQELTSHTEE